MRIKHVHHFEFFGTVNGRDHGIIKRCGCGARWFGGAIGDTLGERLTTSTGHERILRRP